MFETPSQVMPESEEASSNLKDKQFEEEGKEKLRQALVDLQSLVAKIDMLMLERYNMQLNDLLFEESYAFLNRTKKELEQLSNDPELNIEAVVVILRALSNVFDEFLTIPSRIMSENVYELQRLIVELEDGMNIFDRMSILPGESKEVDDLKAASRHILTGLEEAIDRLKKKRSRVQEYLEA